MRFLFLTCAHHLSHVCLVAIAGAAQPARRINNPRWRRDAAPQRAPPNTCPLTQSTQNYTQNTHKKHTYRSQTDHIQRTDSVDRNDLSTQLTQLTRLCTIDASFRSKRSNARRKTCCPTRAELEWYNTLTHLWGLLHTFIIPLEHAVMKQPPSGTHFTCVTPIQRQQQTMKHNESLSFKEILNQSKGNLMILKPQWSVTADNFLSPS